MTACGYPPRATRVAPKVDKYRRSAALTGAPVECGVRRSTPGGPAELQKAPARGMAPAMAIPGDQFQPFAVLRFAPVAFRFASRGICAGHRRATTSATTSATTPDVPLSRAFPQIPRIRTGSFQIRLARPLCRPPTCDDFSDDSRCASLARLPSERTLPLVGRRWSSAARRHWPLGSSATVPRASLAWLMCTTSATYTCRPAAPEPPTYAARSGGRQHGLWVPSRRGQQPFSLSNERVGRGAIELAACAAHEHR